jgi:SsrA-binding protein
MDSYAHCDNGELFVYHVHIGPYERGNIYNHDPYRKRRLLVHKKEIVRLSGEVDRKRLTLIPLQMYWKKQWVKFEIGLCRGRKQYDKRAKIASQDSKRRLSQLVKASFRQR